MKAKDRTKKKKKNIIRKYEIFTKAVNNFIEKCQMNHSHGESEIASEQVRAKKKKMT